MMCISDLANRGQLAERCANTPNRAMEADYNRERVDYRWGSSSWAPCSRCSHQRTHRPRQRYRQIQRVVRSNASWSRNWHYGKKGMTFDPEGPTALWIGIRLQWELSL